MTVQYSLQTHREKQIAVPGTGDTIYRSVV